MKNALMATLVNWIWLRKESLCLRIYQWKLPKLKSKEKNKHRENKKVSEQRKELKDESNPLGLN